MGDTGDTEPKRASTGGGRCQGPARLLRAPGKFIPRVGPPPSAGSLKLWGGPQRWRQHRGSRTHSDTDRRAHGGSPSPGTGGSRAAGPLVPDGDEETTGGQAAGATLPAVPGRTFLGGCSWGWRGERTGASVSPPCLPFSISCPLLCHCPLTHDTPCFHGQRPEPCAHRGAGARGHSGTGLGRAPPAPRTWGQMGRTQLGSG